MVKKTQEVVKQGMFEITVPWREVPYAPKYEMSQIGEVRDVKTKKKRTSMGRFTYSDGSGKRKSIPVWKVYEELWPDRND